MRGEKKVKENRAEQHNPSSQLRKNPPCIFAKSCALVVVFVADVAVAIEASLIFCTVPSSLSLSLFTNTGPLSTTGFLRIHWPEKTPFLDCQIQKN